MGRTEKKTGARAAVIMAQGGGLAFLLCLLLMLLCSALILLGRLDGGNARQFAVASCALGGFLGGWITVRRMGRRALPVGLGVGGILFLLLTLLQLLLLDQIPSGAGLLAPLLACLCAGGLAGLIGKKGKKRRARSA